MANFEIAYKRSMANEGIISPQYAKDKNKDEIVLCSNCFKDEGLKLDAEKIGIPNQNICANCSTLTGSKLSREVLFSLTTRFFVRGTLFRSKYGGTPVNSIQ